MNKKEGITPCDRVRYQLTDRRTGQVIRTIMLDATPIGGASIKHGDDRFNVIESHFTDPNTCRITVVQN